MSSCSIDKKIALLFSIDKIEKKKKNASHMAVFGPGGLLKYDLGRDVMLRLEKWTHFYTKFCRKMRCIFIPEPQILSKVY